MWYSGLMMNKSIKVIGYAVCALALAGCAQSAQPVRLLKPASGYNVAIIVIDALRADHVGAYGYHRNTTPFLDSLAAQGLVFERASSHSTFTRESVSALLSGVLPSENPVGMGWFAKPDPDRKNLAELFADAGYRTGFFTDTPVFEEAVFAKGFSDYERLPTPWGASGSGMDLSKRALAFTGNTAGKPFMMYVHYLDPHDPYEPPDAFYRRFAKERFPNPINVMQEVRPFCHDLIKQGFGPGEARFEDMVLRYDAEIAEQDAAIEALFRGMDQQGLLDKTLFIITSDHGEEFLDHDFVEHAWTVYEEVLHIPLILWRPGVAPAGRIADRVKLADLLPTLTQAIGVRCDRTDLAGEAWFAEREGQWVFVPPVKPVIAEMMLETRGNVRALIYNDYKYIASPKWLTPEGCAEATKQQKLWIAQCRIGTFAKTDPFGPAVYEALYDLRADPREKNNILATNPAKARELKAMLDAYVAVCAKRPHRSEPPPPAELTPEMRKQLDDLGYF